MAFLAQIIDPVEVNFYSIALDQVNLPRRGKFLLCRSGESVHLSPPPHGVNFSGDLHVKFLKFRRGKFTWSREIYPVEVNFYSVALDQVNLPRRKFKNFTCKTPGKFTWLGGGLEVFRLRQSKFTPSR